MYDLLPFDVLQSQILVRFAIPVSEVIPVLAVPVYSTIGIPLIPRTMPATSADDHVRHGAVRRFARL